MSQDIRDFVPPSCDLLGLGEPTHQEPAFGLLRNELLAQLVALGFRSIAMETDRAAALLVNDYVQDGVGTLDSALRDGFSHGLGGLAANRQLLAWMRDFNRDRPAEERLAFHGFDAPTEMMSAPSPRLYLEYGRDYLGLDVDIAGLAGDDERWSRTEAIMDPAVSIGATAEAEKLRAVADDMLTLLYMGAPGLIAKTSRARWFRAKTQLMAGLALLRYHRQAAQRLAQEDRVSLLLGIRDALMAQNLLDIRAVEDRRGATLIAAHNQHLQRSRGGWQLADMQLTWHPAGAIVASLIGDRYAVIAGSLGRSEALNLREPEPDTYEGRLQTRFPTWGLLPVGSVEPGRKRTDPVPEQGYFPLDPTALAGVDTILHVSGNVTTG
jgi:erythromycin esterase-like protein